MVVVILCVCVRASWFNLRTNYHNFLCNSGDHHGKEHGSHGSHGHKDGEKMLCLSWFCGNFVCLSFNFTNLKLIPMYKLTTYLICQANKVLSTVHVAIHTLTHMKQKDSARSDTMLTTRNTQSKCIELLVLLFCVLLVSFMKWFHCLYEFCCDIDMLLLSWIIWLFLFRFAVIVYS